MINYTGYSTALARRSATRYGLVSGTGFKTRKIVAVILMPKEQYKTMTVEAAKTGWIVREKGKPAEIFTRWDWVVKKLEMELTSKGDSAGV